MMVSTISTTDWKRYIQRLKALNTEAGNKMQEYVAKNGFVDRNALISYAHALVTKYGEGSAELACQMYEAIAEMEGKYIVATPSDTATIQEVGKAINGSLKQSETGQLLDSVVQRLVKMSSADTMLKNCIKHGSQFAWIPYGDTCAFCLTLGSRGWQNVSNQTLKNGHAEHIHAHCDCQYAIRFNENTNVSGYDPDALLDLYNSSDGSPKDKINAIRRESYKLNASKINEQKRLAYKARKERQDEIAEA